MHACHCRCKGHAASQAHKPMFFRLASGWIQAFAANVYTCAHILSYARSDRQTYTQEVGHVQRCAHHVACLLACLLDSFFVCVCVCLFVCLSDLCAELESWFVHMFAGSGADYPETEAQASLACGVLKPERISIVVVFRALIAVLPSHSTREPVVLRAGSCSQNS